MIIVLSDKIGQTLKAMDRGLLVSVVRDGWK
jgi:hypothetical protein